MKKIRCQLCEGAWIVEDDDLEKQKVCPYCETSIQGKVEFDTYDSLDKAIYGAVTKMGNGVFQNLRQLSGFILDTAPNLRKEIRIFSKTVTDDYATYIRTLFDQDMDEAEMTVRKLKQLFIEEEGLSETWADMICEALYGAAMYYNGYGITKMINATVEDTLISNSKSSSIYSDDCDETKDIEQNKEYNTTDCTLKDIEKYSIIDHYKCMVCGYIIDGYDLEYGESQNCPICHASCWQITNDELNEDISEQYTYSSSKINNTYNTDSFRVILDNAKKMLSEKKTEAALEECRRAANGGYVPAYNLIASIYYSKRNYKKAWKWYLKAAEANDSEGQYYVGLFYQKGLHVKKNIHMAIKYFEKSSEQNNGNALVALADIYTYGKGIQKDLEKAIVFLTTAAENENAKAQYKLGELYQNGNIIGKDIMKAAQWYQQAAKMGNPEARKRLEECVSEMPLNQKIKWKLR